MKIYLSREKKFAEKGQALLIVLITMAIALTVVLSILSRSILDVGVSEGEKEALRAFSAAEAGLEKALIVGSSIGTTDLGTSQFSAEVSDFASGLSEFVYPIELLSGEMATFWFVNHDDEGEMTCSAEKPCFTGSGMKLCWGDQDTPTGSEGTPALEVSVFYLSTPGDYSTAQVARAVYDPSSSRSISNNFSVANTDGCFMDPDTLQFYASIDFSDLGIPASSYSRQDGLQFARARMLYNSEETHPVGINVDRPAADLLPPQGLMVDSSGSAGESNRRIEVFRGFSEPPPVFESVIFSGGSIIK